MQKIKQFFRSFMVSVMEARYLQAQRIVKNYSWIR